MCLVWLARRLTRRRKWMRCASHGTLLRIGKLWIKSIQAYELCYMLGSVRFTDVFFRIRAVF